MNQASTRPVGELLRELGRDVTDLVRNEIALVRAESVAEGRSGVGRAH